MLKEIRAKNERLTGADWRSNHYKLYMHLI